MTKTAVLAILIAGVSSPAFAQTPSTQEDSQFAGIYLKIGAVHGRGSISGMGFKVTGLSGEIEHHFSENKFWLSGWSFGYRKDDIRNANHGHLINSKVFRRFKIWRLTLKPALGFEYGVPSSHFDTTEFTEAPHLQYTHRSLVRNTNVPFFNQNVAGVWYPFVETSIITRKGPFLIEAGFGFNIMRFAIDRFDVPSDQGFTSIHDSITRPVPFLFFNIGFEIKHFFNLFINN